MKNSKKLDQLTSLRFIAAMMIVIHHSVGVFGIENFSVNLGQGVSFFFVLSGFILTYVYPNLENISEIRKFYISRIARIWPVYLVTFIIVLICVSFPLSFDTFLAFIFMVQSWVPMSRYYFSYNAVSWSISTEVFFYLVFPILIQKWDSQWLIKFIISGFLLLLIMLAANYFSLPDYGNPYNGNDGFLITQHGLIYINPLSRIFEFILGMVIARLYFVTNNVFSFAMQSTLEVLAVLLCILNIAYQFLIIEALRNPFLGTALTQWLTHSSSLLSFGFLIFIVAKGNGFISKILTLKPLILLGEISFSMYLVHQTIITLYKQNASKLPDVPNLILFLIFMALLVTISYLIWFFIEIPSRKVILKRYR
jgi:peptidoglycan/LPS O-acetylase OafA/YrhL